MPSNNSLSDKVAHNPLRFGLIAGFLGVPLLWMAGDSLVSIAMGQGPLPVETFWSYEASGALIGAFLGGQGMCVWSKWRNGDVAEACGIALVTGWLGFVFYASEAALLAATTPFFFAEFGRNLLHFVIERHLPFLLCVLLLFLSLFAPRR